MLRRASPKVKTPSRKVRARRNADPISIGKSTWMSSNSILITFLLMMAAIPKTKNMFAMLEPTTFPATISDEPFITAIIDETNSGNDVPIATIVTPIMNEGILKKSPIFSAESVK